MMFKIQRFFYSCPYYYFSPKIVISQVTSFLRIASSLIKQYGDNSNPQIFIINNELEYFGFNSVLGLLFKTLSSLSMNEQESRCGSDGIRAIAIMLLPQYRTGLQFFVKGTRTDRVESDQADDVNIAWATQMLIEFDNPDFVLERPDGVRDEDLEDVNPNDRERIIKNAKKHDAKWLINVWKTYVKKKYRESIKRWETGTGLGGGDHSLFGNFCKNDRWLSWIYQLD